jgi:hypothetical protein
METRRRKKRVPLRITGEYVPNREAMLKVLEFVLVRRRPVPPPAPDEDPAPEAGTVNRQESTDTE